MPPQESSFFVDYTNTHAALSRADSSAGEHFGSFPQQWLEKVIDDCDIALGAPFSGICYMAEGTSEKHQKAFRDAGFQIASTNPSSTPVQLSVDALTQDLADTVVVVGWLSTYIPLLEEIAADGGEKPIVVSFPLAGQAPEGSDDADYRAVSALPAFEKSLGRAIRRNRPVGTSQATPSNRPTELLLKMAAEIERDAQATGTLPAGALPSLYKRFPDFATDSNWLGFRGLLPLTRAVLDAYAGPLEIGGEGNDWKVIYTPSKPGTGEASTSVSSGENGDQLAEIYSWLGDHLAAQPAPVPAANAASLLADKFGENLVDSGWLGHRSFRAFIEAAKEPRVSFSTVGPGYLFTPGVHSDPEETYGHDAFALADPELASVAKQLQTEHGVPYLSPESYAVLFRAIALELEQNPFSLGGTSKGARDRCPTLGTAIPRSALNAVLKMILTTPHRFGEGTDQPNVLAAALLSAVSKLSPDTPVATLEKLFVSAL